VDEATQAVEAVCWVPILKSKKLILAGDPQQVCLHLGIELMLATSDDNEQGETIEGSKQ
jgi:hypothetical protein